MPKSLEALKRDMQQRPNAGTQLDIARLYREQGHRQEALQAYQRAIAMQPQAAVLYYNLGTFLQELKEYPQAIRLYREALQRKPTLIQAWYNLGLVYLKQDSLDDARDCLTRAIEYVDQIGSDGSALSELYLQSWNNLGLVYQGQRKFDDAEDCFNRALEHGLQNNCDDLSLAEVHRHRAMLWLLLGDFDQGWPEYEWRYTAPDAVDYSLPLPVWDGAPLTDKTILVYAEQGVGDEIMFAACYSFILARAQQAIIACEPRLTDLFRRSFTDATVIGSAVAQDPGWLSGIPEIDCQVPAGSLPGHMPCFPEGLSAGKGYLSPDPEALKKWQRRYTGLGPGLKVGISWRGGRNTDTQRKRSTLLEQWQQLFQLEDVQFINIQYGDCTKELQQVFDQHGVKIHDWDDSDAFNDLDGLAAQMAALDLVVSVDNTSVHMAGALGVPVWILQPYVPDWRWLLDCTDSYWYRAVRQFRQPCSADWTSVFARVKLELEKLTTAQ